MQPGSLTLFFVHSLCVGMQYWNCIRIAADYVKASVGGAEMAIVLGSGLMDFVDKFLQEPKPKVSSAAPQHITAAQHSAGLHRRAFERPEPLCSLLTVLAMCLTPSAVFVCSLSLSQQMIEYSKVPYMPGTNVPGHSGKIFVGNLATKNGMSKVMCFAGRVHAYEGWAAAEFNFIVRLAHACGVKLMILTNSAGGALSGMSEGSIMMIRDHLRFSGVNPMQDVSDDPRFGPKHTTSSHAYSSRIASIVTQAAQTLSMESDVLSGTYCWSSGPSYETPAEVQAGMKLSVGSLGGAFGMSTVPEVLAAHNLGMEVFALSLCTNLAAGLGHKELTHGDVKIVAEVAGPRFQNLLLEMFANLDIQSEEASLAAGKPRLQPVGFELASASASLHSLGCEVPSRSLYPLAGWTPSLQDVYGAVDRLATANGGGSGSGGPSAFSLVAGVLFLGGRHQRAVGTLFVQGLRDLRTLPFRELTPAFAAHPDMLSSYARTAMVVLGSVPCPASSELALGSAATAGKRVLVVVSPDGNGLVGLNAAESSLLVQALQALGASTILASGVGVDTQSRGVSGPTGDSCSSSSAANGRVVLLEDVLDRTVDPLPLTLLAASSASPECVRPVSPHHTPLFDPSLNLALERALLAAGAGGGADGGVGADNKNSKHAPTVQVGSYLAFQGPMLPSEAELNLCFHAGCVATAGIGNMQFSSVAKELGLRVAVALTTVPQVTELPEEAPHQPQSHAAAAAQDEHSLASTVAQAFAQVILAQNNVEHLARNVRTEHAAAFLSNAAAAAAPAASVVAAAPAVSGAGFGPVSFVAAQESFEDVSVSAGWLVQQLGSFLSGESESDSGAPAPAPAAAIKTMVFAEAMLAPAFDSAEFETKWECGLLDVPRFANFCGLGSANANTLNKSGCCFPYDPRVLMGSWRLRLARVVSTSSLVLLLLNTAAASTSATTVPAFHGLTYFVRVAKLLNAALGLTNVLLLSQLASCEPGLGPGSLVLVKDHINLTGLNPLFGENTHQFGPRFNDMSVVYKAAGRACFTAQEAGAAIPSSVLAQVVNPALASRAEGALARAVHASTLTAGFAPLATIAKHAEVFVTGLGYIFRSAGSNACDDAALIKPAPSATATATATVFQAATLPSPEAIANIRKLVLGAIEKLHEAGLAHNATIQAAVHAA